MERPSSTTVPTHRMRSGLSSTLRSWESIIEGAATAGARLVFGDNLYANGPVDGPLTEDLPHRATGPNGRTRARIAEALLGAHEAGRIRATIGRGSDFFGPHVHLSTVGDRVFARAIEGRPAQVLGDPDVPHTVTYIEDFARALVTLGAREEALGQVWHVPNAETFTMRRFVQMVFEAAGHPAGLRAAPRWGIALAAPFNPTLRAVKEQLYQSERPWVVDSSKFERAFGWDATPLPAAVSATVAWFRERARTDRGRLDLGRRFSCSSSPSPRSVDPSDSTDARTTLLEQDP
jgi:nucleoside-diphosphate-sugar epimerase